MDKQLEVLWLEFVVSIVMHQTEEILKWGQETAKYGQDMRLPAQILLNL